MRMLCALSLLMEISGVPCREIASSTALIQKEPWCWTTASRGSCGYTSPLQRSGRQSLWPWDVGDIHGPDLIGTVNLQPYQQIRVDFVAGMFLAAIRFLVDSFDPHLFIRVETCFRPTLSPSNLRRSLSIRAPAKGYRDFGVESESVTIFCC